jgi:hypothetical protein
VKFISWNLRNVSDGKLLRDFSEPVASAGLGNTMLDYVVNVVMGNACWSNVNTPRPADAFMVIELKCGGHQKGHAAFGSDAITMGMLTGAMNLYARLHGLAGDYVYGAAPRLIVGTHETVGIIYNTQRLDNPRVQVLRDVNVRYVNPRSPFSATFTLVGADMEFTLTGIHAPPPGGSGDQRYRRPIQFLEQMATCPALATEWQMVAGDYNCDPTDTYETGGGMQVGWEWQGYGTNLAPGTLTSVRQKIAGGQPTPEDYMSAAYDNLLFNYQAQLEEDERVLDLIGNARRMTVDPPVPLYPASRVSLLNNYNSVSDHMPMVLEFVE